MKAEYINPFLAAISSTFEHLEVKWQRGIPSLVHSPLQMSGITTDIGITGDIQGKFFLSCTLDTALSLANKFGSTFGMPPSTDFNEMERSAFSEITNLIGGQTATGFSGSNLHVDISPPSITEGESILTTVFTSQIFKIPIMIEEAEITIYVALR